MLLCKINRSGTEPVEGFKAARADKSTEQDWNKLIRLLSFIATSSEDMLTLEADDSNSLN